MYWRPSRWARRSATLPRPRPVEASWRATTSGSSARSSCATISRRSSRRWASPVSPEEAPPCRRLKVTTRSGRGGSAAATAPAPSSRMARNASHPASRTGRSVRERVARGGEDPGDVGDVRPLAGEADEGDVAGGHAPERRLQREERGLHDGGGDLRLPGGVVKPLGLEEDHRVGIANGADQEGAGVPRTRRNDHLQTRNVGVELLLRL